MSSDPSDKPNHEDPKPSAEADSNDSAESSEQPKKKDMRGLHAWDPDFDITNHPDEIWTNAPILGNGSG